MRIPLGFIGLPAGSPMKPSGIRIGTPAVTTRGMKEADVETVADLIYEALTNKDDEAKLAEIQKRVFSFNEAFPMPY